MDISVAAKEIRHGIMLRSGKIRHTYMPSEDFDVYGMQGESMPARFVARKAETIGIMGLVDISITLAESLKEKGLEVYINGNTIDHCKENLSMARSALHDPFYQIRGLG